LAITGYPPRDFLLYPAFCDAAETAVHDLASLSKDKNYALVVGTIGRNTGITGKPIQNQAVFLRDGKIEARYSKGLLPTYDVFDEARYFEPGDTYCIVEFENLRLALTVCEDIWNDNETLSEYRSKPLSALPPFDVLINLSASPFTVGKQRLREEMLAAVAVKYDVHALYVNSVGGNDDLIFDGRSAHFSRDGILRSRARGFDEDVVCVDVGGESGVGHIAEDTFDAESETWRALVSGTRDYCRKTGHGYVILGLSGGIDSALTAAVACAAVGPENVLAVLMPSPWSSDHSRADAGTLAKNFGIKTSCLAIEQIMRAYDVVLENEFAGRPTDVTEENLQARIRGNLLMALSNKFGCLLLTTGNKSEISVGYCTLYGDMCGALAVIGDLYKTEVYRLCHWYNARHMTAQIPENILRKAPSAELRPGQTDQDSLPPYEELDAVLKALVEERLSMRELTHLFPNKTTVKRVMQLLARAEFKRRQAPPVLKITRQAYGVGRRMPVAACSNFLH
jgi:NAD+ synthase/NAD+ synthase (glutamine-hydrolysing)